MFNWIKKKKSILFFNCITEDFTAYRPIARGGESLAAPKKKKIRYLLD